MAEKALIDAASLKDDTEMLLEITSVDLIAKEFQKHEKCYRNYTRNKKQEKLQGKSLDENVAHGNYDAVLSVITDNILERQECLSMETLQTVYGVGVGSRQSRHKLKCRLQKTFGDKLIFLSHHSPGVWNTIHQVWLLARNVCRHKLCQKHFNFRTKILLRDQHLP